MWQYRHKPMGAHDDLWVVTMISNPERYKSRYALYERFRTGVERAGAKLLTVEVAFGDRPFELTQANDGYDLQLRTNDEIWHKENALNLGFARLPLNWKYVAWVDADVEFVRHDWVEETVHQLQHFHVVQMFQHAIDLGPSGETLKTDTGFVWRWQREGLPRESKYYGGLHPGYAWAARREAIDAVGGLMDFAILGAADRHMAFSLVGRGMDTASKDLTPGYRKQIQVWQDRATRHIRQNVGYVPGSIVHHFHGKKVDRKYHDRWKILLKHGYNPEWDLKRDWQGLYTLTDQGLRLRNDIREYFRSRNEDSIDP